MLVQSSTREDDQKWTDEALPYTLGHQHIYRSPLREGRSEWRPSGLCYQNSPIAVWIAVALNWSQVYTRSKR